jgi:hypothetical protein
MKPKPIVTDPLRVSGHVTFYNVETNAPTSTSLPASGSLTPYPSTGTPTYEMHAEKPPSQFSSASPVVVLSNGANQPIVRTTSHLKAETHVAFVRPSLSSPTKSLPHAMPHGSTESDDTSPNNSNPVRTNGLMLFYNPTSLSTPSHATGVTHTSQASTSTSMTPPHNPPTANPAPSKSIKLKSLTKAKSETAAMMRDESKRKVTADKTSTKHSRPHTSTHTQLTHGKAGKQSPMMFVQV